MKRFNKNNRPYKALDIDFAIPEDLQDSIDKFLKYLNTDETGLTEDCYRTEIDCDINHCASDGMISGEQVKILKEYYVWRGIYDTTD